MHQEREDKLWQRWIAGPQFSVSFEDFKKSLQPVRFKDESALLRDVEAILNGGHHGNI